MKRKNLEIITLCLLGFPLVSIIFPILLLFSNNTGVLGKIYIFSIMSVKLAIILNLIFLLVNLRRDLEKNEKNVKYLKRMGIYLIILQFLIMYNFEKDILNIELNFQYLIAGLLCIIMSKVFEAKNMNEKSEEIKLD